MDRVIVVEFLQFIEQLPMSRRSRQFDVLRRDSHFRRILHFHSDVNVGVFPIADLSPIITQIKYRPRPNTTC